MPKSKKKPAKPDFAQSALATLLKATGQKTLVESKVVAMPKQKKAR